MAALENRAVFEIPEILAKLLGEPSRRAQDRSQRRGKHTALGFSYGTNPRRRLSFKSLQAGVFRAVGMRQTRAGTGILCRRVAAWLWRKTLPTSAKHIASIRTS